MKKSIEAQEVHAAPIAQPGASAALAGHPVEATEHPVEVAGHPVEVPEHLFEAPKHPDEAAARPLRSIEPAELSGPLDPDPRRAPHPAGDVRTTQRPSPRSAPEFPGCRAVTITREAIATYEGRYELWDAETETAWMVREPTGAAHEQPSQRLARLGGMIADARGAPVECLGSTDLERRDAQGRRQRIMQADQAVYVHPRRMWWPAGAIVVGEHPYPDVILEVDHTTDVRRGKLALYEGWGFPEVWVEVPERTTPSRPAGRRPGLTIHVLEGGAYLESAVSRAFPGWTVEEIHTALNEEVLSSETCRSLARVGRALGERGGTGPDDMPWLRAHRREARAAGRAEGIAQEAAQGIERQRSLLCRQAARRFGDATTVPLAALLGGINDPEHLAEIGDWIVDCATGVELLARMARD